jgi:hypothetical protein
LLTADRVEQGARELGAFTEATQGAWASFQHRDGGVQGDGHPSAIMAQGDIISASGCVRIANACTSLSQAPCHV